MDLQQLLSIVREAAGLMSHDHFSVTQKGGYSNIVTSSDLAVQQYLCQRLSEAMPGSGFICEEEDYHDIQHDNLWIIDPIDGTANYSRGIAQCAICVGLWSHGQMQMSVVHIPWAGETFWAERGKGAWLNGERIHVSDRPFGNSILCCALPVYHKEHAAVCSDIITETFAQCNDIRRFGAAAPEICYLACGRCDLYFEYLLSPWDFAAASLILEEAGGVICRPDGKPLDPTQPSGVVGANTAENQERMLHIIGRHLSSQTRR